MWKCDCGSWVEGLRKLMGLAQWQSSASGNRCACRMLLPAPNLVTQMLVRLDTIAIRMFANCNFWLSVTLSNIPLSALHPLYNRSEQRHTNECHLYKFRMSRIKLFPVVGIGALHVVQDVKVRNTGEGLTLLNRSRERESVWMCVVILG